MRRHPKCPRRHPAYARCTLSVEVVEAELDDDTCPDCGDETATITYDVVVIETGTHVSRQVVRACQSEDQCGWSSDVVTTP